MKTAQWPGLRLTLLLIWGVFALILTTQSDRVPLVHLMTSTIGSTDLGATVGHAGLFAALTGIAYVAFALRLPGRRALMLAMALALLAGTGTELFQMFVADRAASLSDLLANWLGVFVTGFIIAYRQMHVQSTTVG
jgi:hypothetical protein